MIAVRLPDGSTVYAFGESAAVARRPSGGPDDYWQRVAEDSIRGAGRADAGLMALPGAKLIYQGAVRPTPLHQPPAVPTPQRKPPRRDKGL